jgi:Zn-dependent protease with chaperone function
MRMPVILCLFLAACGTTYEVPVASPAGGAAAPASSRPGVGRTAADFRQVVARVEPAAEAFCREEAVGAPQAYCDFRVLLETVSRMPPNAFQTRGRDGRPVVVVGARLLEEMQSNDEIAFVLSHEMSHHIAGHIDKQEQQQALGALIFGGLAAAGGNAYGGPASEQAIRQAMDLGAFVGARAYAQSYELEADTLGAYVTARAGYDPERGADVFGRPALANPGGPPLLASHPASVQRQATVAGVAAEIRRQQAAGLVPRPYYAGRA